MTDSDQKWLRGNVLEFIHVTLSHFGDFLFHSLTGVNLAVSDRPLNESAATLNINLSRLEHC